MPNKKTAKVPLTQDLFETCEALLDQVRGYRNDLEHELNQVKSQNDPYIHHIRALEQLLPRVRQLEDLIIDKVLQAAQEIAELDSHL